MKIKAAPSILLGMLLFWAARAEGWCLSVTLYGANGADLLDDTAAFQNCINANQLIEVPAGTYYISTKLSLPPNRTLRGVPNDPSAVVMKIVGSIDGIDVGPAANTTVEDLTLERVDPNLTGRMLVYATSSRFTARRVHVLDQRATVPSIFADSATSGTIEDCYVRNFGWFDVGSGQARGSGIRLSDCTGCVVRNNRVVENQNLVPASPVSNFYQAGGIEISGCVDTLVEYNTVVTAGNGIDAGQAVGCTIRFNTVRNCHEVGIKLVNGAHDNLVYANVIDKVGIANIWLTPGSPGPSQGAVYGNVIRENLLRGCGLGIGVDYWTVPNYRPSAIALEGSNANASNVARNNVIVGNTIQPTRKLIQPVVEYTGFSFDPIDNDISDNALLPAEHDDYGFFRPAFGAGLWRAVFNAGGDPPDIDGTSGDFVLVGEFGNASASDVPLVGDVNADGADDRVIYNAATHAWTWDSAARLGVLVLGGFGDGVAEQPAAAFGEPGDVPLLGDINGDGAADRVVFRPADKSWHVDLSRIPVWPYEPASQGFGDGLEDVLGGSAVYDAGGVTIHRVALSDYDGNGIADRTIFSAGSFYRTLNPGGGAWSDATDNASLGVGLGNAGFIPPPWLGDFDGDGVSDNMAWNGIGNSTIYARLSTTIPAWSEPPTVQGNHYGDPNQDVYFFVGDLNPTAYLLPVALAAFTAE